MINVINEQACFFNVCKAVFMNIESIIVLVSVFVMKYFNHELFVKRFFLRVARMSFVNINNEFLEIMLHSLNDEKRMSFLKILAEYVSNKEKDFVFIVNSLNV